MPHCIGQLGPRPRPDAIGLAPRPLWPDGLLRLQRIDVSPQSEFIG